MTNAEFRRNLLNSVTAETCWISTTPAGSFYTGCGTGASRC